MKKKYTIEEFKEMFDRAKNEAIEKLDKQFKEIAKDEDRDMGMQILAFSMQNMMAIAELRRALFKENN